MEKLVQRVVKKNSLAECNIEELEKISSQYPYFGIAPLLVTLKSKEGKIEDDNKQAEKTSLYFYNPLWLDYLLTHFESRPSEIKEAVTIQRMEQPKDTAATPQDIIFEPYHTVDYFASQGIKFKPEEKPQDKFGQQLKSFTEWLKTMKRVPVAEIVKEVSSGEEKKVVQLAEHSIEDRDVVTEAMAEVWEKQGNAGKAIEIYTKLSLHNPSKSSYFAAKIEQLKKPK
jgi:hypothetical protein